MGKHKLVYYTCDKQVLWESVGAFFSARQLVSGVHGLVVRPLLVNLEISCSTRCVCAHFKKKICGASKQSILVAASSE